MDSAVEGLGVGEGPMGEMMILQIAPHRLDVVELGRVLRVRQWPRAASASVAALLTWMGPLSRTMTTGFIGRPGRGP